RIVRALEVIRLTGRPFSSFGAGMTATAPVVPVRIAGLAVPTAETSNRIEARVDAMARAGLLEEVRRLSAAPWSDTARQAIGYKEVLAYVRGEMASYADALLVTVQRSRAFARRQRAWFGREARVQWFDASGGSGTGTDKSSATRDAVVAWWSAA
ncbi:MAG: tRNA (adenosine(37)-N6)-dimethylallyltransferase MiaA, partial [Acidimicrobiia bacterium]